MTVALDPAGMGAGKWTLSNGNLTAVATGRGAGIWESGASNVLLPAAAKIYHEVAIQDTSGTPSGVMAGWTSNNTTGDNTFPGDATNTGIGVARLDSSGNLQYFINGASTTLGVPFTAGPTAWLGFAINTNVGAIWVTKDGASWNASGSGADPATNTGGVVVTPLIGVGCYVKIGAYANNNKATFNPGSSAFAFTVPSGFTPLNNFFPPSSGVWFHH